MNLAEIEPVSLRSTDVPASEVDGSREHFRQPVHHAERRLVVRHPAVGDILFR